MDSDQEIPELVFLGIAERAANLRDGNTELLKWNIIGLKNIILFYFHPAVLSDVNLVFALRHLSSGPDIRIKIRSESGEQLGFVNVGLSREANPVPPLTGGRGSLLMLQLDETWTTAVLPFKPPSPLTLPRPGRYDICQELPDGSERTVGAFYSGEVDPTPLTSERVAAIKTDPRAAKAVRIKLSCNECNKGIGAYAALEKTTGIEAEGYIWYNDLPDSFHCDCRKVEFDLRAMRNNLFGLLGIRQVVDQSTSIIPLYEKSTLDNLRTEFVHLISSNPREEVLQKFIEENPILLQQFPAERILFKPPLLTRYVADFGVLSPQRELVLIEIEPANMRLLRQNGDHAAPLTHAVNQVQNWLQVVDDHRISCLTEMRIEPTTVGNIRGVVIAGRDAGYDTAHLRQLKGVFSGRISILTYDDLLGSLATLIDQIGRL
ncbi:MAG TPA: Shedu anti-phage system protein SduA domain-containing protein [Stellaceae bacterium]|nr:Shedu anti-phage system protein SduA domain-containing protein [Stellaceae bacterium]